ncbi:MAG: nitrite/sulfite reductase [Pseudomonadota bacterium]
MYKYQQIDQQIVDQRVVQFRDQTRRFLAGELANHEYLPLRLQNGLYIQRHAPMLRVAIPYGMVSSKQLRGLARIAREFDKGYGHISTRQNMQFNWPKLEQVPDVLALLASIQMHAVQTSGNCIRNTTTDQFAGVARDEIVDPRPYCELIRQWSTFHPEFAYLPRKFKIAVGSDAEDRAAIKVHDIGVQLYRADDESIFYRVFVGGGLGRTPMVGVCIKDDLAEVDLLTYLEAILRVYNRYGRRDNKFKARIKILVKALGPDAFKAKVDAEWAHIVEGPIRVTETELQRLKSFFVDPPYENLADNPKALVEAKNTNKQFANWCLRNVRDHKKSGYSIVHLALKQTGTPPGDINDEQLNAIADLADEYSYGEARTTHFQNMVLSDVRQDKLFELWIKLTALDLATANFGFITDIICCPGGDFCSLANAKSIPVAEEIQQAFDDLDYLYDLGPIDLNISGCMNACGHHHVGHIGILGVDKKGLEFYQISIGGSSRSDANIGQILGPSFQRSEVVGVIKRLLDIYVERRAENETFVATAHRIGMDPFKEAIYV